MERPGRGCEAFWMETARWRNENLAAVCRHFSATSMKAAKRRPMNGFRVEIQTLA